MSLHRCIVCLFELTLSSAGLGRIKSTLLGRPRASCLLTIRVVELHLTTCHCVMIWCHPQLKLLHVVVSDGRELTIEVWICDHAWIHHHTRHIWH